jgi:methylmalonyl-CoA/ethylmalonyl-CoA epimerase
MNFHHAGIATEDASGLATLFGDLLDAPVVDEETLAELSVTFLQVGDGVLELLEPVGDGEDPISQYLDSYGPGIHHLAFATADVDAALARARDQGLETIDDEPRTGAMGHEVAFLHPRSTGGVLVEFVGE